ncbi:AsnC family protein [Streptomyces sp. NPDC002928]|uniref:Lrp/AsnC family transcriptional regulator n=1 Tax=Streptomyces sp. NPDC002928 TaxID=3154440 RepID=UPI0033B44C81
MPAGGAGRPGPRQDGPKLDDLDRALIHALHVDGRAPFSRIACVLGVSAQTVARRYARLRAQASLRVAGPADPDRAGRTQWLVRITATAGSARNIARALVRRPDTSRVKLASSLPGAVSEEIAHTQPARLVPLGFIDLTVQIQPSRTG